MLSSPQELSAVRRVSELEPCVARLELRLANLAGAICRADPLAIETEACELHKALAIAILEFNRAARSGGLPPELRHRLMNATGQVAAQREALARATAALDRAIDVLLPDSADGLYSLQGAPARAGQGSLLA